MVVVWCGGLVWFFFIFFTNFNTTLRLHWVTLGVQIVEQYSIPDLSHCNVQISKDGSSLINLHGPLIEVLTFSL